MKFKICWLEFTDRLGKELKEFLETLPNPKITGTYPYDEQVEIECVDYFPAKNIKEAIKFVAEAYCDVEIFTVFNAETGERLFTEEDLT